MHATSARLPFTTKTPRHKSIPRRSVALALARKPWCRGVSVTDQLSGSQAVGHRVARARGRRQQPAAPLARVAARRPQSPSETARLEIARAQSDRIWELRRPRIVDDVGAEHA